MTILRNGDFSIAKLKEVPTEAKEFSVEKNEFIFGIGEKTNHMHTLHAPKIDDMKWYKMPDGSYIVDLKTGGYVTHPEHSMKTDLRVPRGIWRLYQRREKDWFSGAVRRVVD